MTPETQVEADARDGFVTYDEFTGPELDAALWSPARLPLPTGGEHIPLDPSAELGSSGMCSPPVGSGSRAGLQSAASSSGPVNSS